MKKSMIVAMLVAMLALNALVAFGIATSYVQPQSMTTAATGVAHPAQPTARPARVCNLQVTTATFDVYFLGKARQECMVNNKNDLVCMQQCFSQVKTLARQGVIGRARSPLGPYSQLKCGVVDSSIFAGVSASRCYFDSTVECSKANPGNDFCRRKCVENTYSFCRQNMYLNKQK